MPLSLSARPADSLPEPRRVVILNATDPYLPAFVTFDGALRATIKARSREPVDFFSETLDMHRFPRELLDDDVVALLEKKYRRLKVDVVLAVTPIALDFAQRHHQDIWPGATLVFEGISVRSLTRLAPESGVQGIPYGLAFARTLDLALRLKPDTRLIAVVSGSGPCCDYLDDIKDALQRRAQHLEARYLVGLSLEDTLAGVAGLPENAVVLFTAIFRDPTGRPLMPRQVLEQLAEQSSAPIFGVYGSQMGHGLTAGWIVPFDVQGRAIGVLVARLLNGADPATIGIQPPLASLCMADWRWLRRWGIDPKRLPEGCELRFRDRSFWEQYYRQLLLVLAVVFAQAALILFLLMQRRRLHKAQQALSAECERRAESEDFAARLRTRLERFTKERSLGVMAATIAHEINQPLIAIQNYAQAAKRRLQSDAPDKTKLVELFTKIDGQSQRAGAITQRVRSLVNDDGPRLQPVAVEPLIDAVMNLLEPERRRLGCAIRSEHQARDVKVMADSLQVQLVLVNLLQNAMQSLAAGAYDNRSILIEVRPVGDFIQVSVIDWGGGVPPERAEEIFEQFSSGRTGGMGLGLAVARAIVEAHGGQLWFAPNPAGGAIFRFTLRVFRP
ncbi:sensor histidine kinase [Rhabdochromatium marinum]|uniref:sensor histidine kinase n=1 Tax=Rhabdochromatium marinum TaxID=48729 RepID=UPI001908DC49|nr:ATP-binding protein [Rhabdochromatium marinum]MBK1650274.1 hypothetical protein [Rhabdochromatium marinum]